MLKRVCLALLLTLTTARAHAAAITASCSADQFTLLCSSSGSVTLNGAAPQVAFFTSTGSLGGVSTFVFTGGNLGVGTAAPATPLEVVGDGFFSGQAEANRVRADQYFIHPGLGQTDVILNSAGTDIGTIQNDAADVWSLGHKTTVSTTLGTPVLSWTTGGSVGIGTTTPSATFEVNGATRLDDGTAQTGYVFTATDNQGNGVWAAGSGGSNSGTAGQLAYFSGATSVVSSTSGVWNGSTFAIFGSTLTQSRAVIAPASLIGGGSADGEVLIQAGNDPTAGGIGGRVFINAGNSNGFNDGNGIILTAGAGLTGGGGGTVRLESGNATGSAVHSVLSVGAVGSNDISLTTGTVHINGATPTQQALCLHSNRLLTACDATDALAGNGANVSGVTHHSNAGGFSSTLGLGATFFAFIPDEAITLERITATVVVAGVGGAGDVYRCQDASGNFVAVTVSAAAAAGSVTTATGTGLVASGVQVNGLLFSSTAVTSPVVNVLCEFSSQ